MSTCESGSSFFDVGRIYLDFLQVLYLADMVMSVYLFVVSSHLSLPCIRLVTKSTWIAVLMACRLICFCDRA